MVLTFQKNMWYYNDARRILGIRSIGLGESSGATAGGEHIPRHFLYKEIKKQLNEVMKEIPPIEKNRRK